MKIFQVIGRTAPWDWAASAEDKQMGLYKTYEGAMARVKELYAEKDWRMEYSKFTVVETTVND